MRRKRAGLEDQIAHYQREAAVYDRTIWSLGNRDNRNHKVKITRLSAALGLSRADRVLEIGVGTGLHARWLLDHRDVHYVGLDASTAMLRVARTRLPQAPLLAADAARMPFADSSVDAAFCSATLHHMDRPWTVLGEMCRVLRPGGRVALMEPNWKFPTNFVEISLQRVEWNCFKISPRTLAEQMTAAGLENVRIERLLYTPPKPERWIPAFDRIDAAVAKVPGLRRLSIMLLASGRKP